MSQRRINGRKLKDLSEEFHNVITKNDFKKDSRMYKVVFNSFNDKWLSFYYRNKTKNSPPAPDGFIKYIALCQ